MLRKYYTPEQAQQQIPKVDRLLRRLVKIRHSLTLLDSMEITCKSCGHNHLQSNMAFNKRYHQLSYEFYRYMELLENMGCVVKDLDLGLVDFLSYHDGREVFLCWKLGEKTISHWHETNDGFLGRKPIWMLMEQRKDKIHR